MIGATDKMICLYTPHLAALFPIGTLNYRLCIEEHSMLLYTVAQASENSFIQHDIQGDPGFSDR
jgi:hypothetical protein